MYHVLVPVDEHEERARKQVDFVTSMPVATDDVLVTLLHAWTGSPDTAPEESADTQTISRVPSVREAVETLQAADIEYDLIDGAGDPADLVLDVVADDGFDQIVMSRGSQSPVGKAVFGSVTQKVMLNSNVPITVISPEDT